MGKNTVGLAGRIFRKQNNDTEIMRVVADARCNYHKVLLLLSEVCNPLKECDKSKGPSLQKNPQRNTNTQTSFCTQLQEASEVS